MSMLAERKQKQRWSLNPRGKHWSEDVNKFGHKMLEKMGWSAGKGLGANEDGITEHVKVSYKNDAKGMGFKDNGEQWTKHEDNFTSLLANLGAGNEAKQISLPKPEKSLEKKSQSSRARVHYHKFMRGKDLATRSEKDIANIFGRKTLERPAEPKEEPEDVNGTEEKSYGVVTVKAGNMADYFKSKLGKFGSFSSSKGDYELNERDDNESEIGACTGFGFASVNGNNEEKDGTPSLGMNKINFVSSQNGKSEDATAEDVTKSNKRKRSDSEDWIEVTSKKKKKSKKNQLAFDNIGSDINPAEEVCYDNPGLNQTDSPQEDDEKSKKKKRVTFSSPITEVLNKSDDSNKTEKPKKKKKNKQLTNGIDNLGCEDNSFEESTQLSNEANEKKTKKKKKRDLVNDENAVAVMPTKKKRKHEEVGIDNLACEEISVNEKNEEIKRYKMKKKAMEHGLVNPACEANDDSIQEESPKKKKKKSKQNELNNLECEENSISADTEVQKKKKKKQKNKNENSLDVSTLSDENEVKTKNKKKNTDEDNAESPSKKSKKKSKNKENGIENLACEINTVEENIASINCEIDNYQTELENELNVKKIKKQKTQNPEETSKKNNSKLDKNSDQRNGNNNIGNRNSFHNRNNKFNNSSFNGQEGPNNFNRSFDGQRGPNNFNRSFDGQRNFNNFNGQNGFNNFNGQKRRFNPDRVDKTSLKALLKPGELKLGFTGSNLTKFAGYGVAPELIGKNNRPDPKPSTETS